MKGNQAKPWPYYYNNLNKLTDKHTNKFVLYITTTTTTTPALATLARLV